MGNGKHLVNAVPLLNYNGEAADGSAEMSKTFFNDDVVIFFLCVELLQVYLDSQLLYVSSGFLLGSFTKINISTFQLLL